MIECTLSKFEDIRGSGGTAPPFFTSELDGGGVLSYTPQLL
jgi:hypothetical protein